MAQNPAYRTAFFEKKLNNTLTRAYLFCTFAPRLIGKQLLLFEYHKSENSSVGRAQPCQGWGREFESRFSL